MAAVLVAILAAGCRRAPLSYSIVAAGPRIAVKPPVPLSAEIRIPKARRLPRPECDVNTGFASLKWDKRIAILQLHSGPIFDDAASAPPGVVLGTDRMYTDSLKDLSDFRSALFDRAAQGCFTAPERRAILNAIVERFELDPLIAYYVRFGVFSQSGFIDLTPDFRLKVVSPSTSGYEISYYQIVSQPNDDRIRLRLVSSPPGPLAGLPDKIGYIRILFWTSLSSSNYYATLLASPGRSALDAATRKFQAAPDAACSPSLGVDCFTVPPNVAVNAEMRVKLNGEDKFVGMGARLGAAIPRTVAPDGKLPAGTQIWRMFRGKPVRLNFEGPEVFQLVLLPGDAIVIPKR